MLKGPIFLPQFSAFFKLESWPQEQQARGKITDNWFFFPAAKYSSYY